VVEEDLAAAANYSVQQSYPLAVAADVGMDGVVMVEVASIGCVAVVVVDLVCPAHTALVVSVEV
jgi:hypothetical protein